MTGPCCSTELGCLQVEPLPDIVPDEWYFMPPPALQEAADTQAGLSEHLELAEITAALQDSELRTSGRCQLHRQPQVLHPFCSDATLATTKRAAGYGCHIVTCKTAVEHRCHSESSCMPVQARLRQRHPQTPAACTGAVSMRPLRGRITPGVRTPQGGNPVHWRHSRKGLWQQPLRGWH